MLHLGNQKRCLDDLAAVLGPSHAVTIAWPTAAALTLGVMGERVFGLRSNNRITTNGAITCHKEYHIRSARVTASGRPALLTAKKV